MVSIEVLEFRQVYRILWLRYIKAVDLSQHCMKSLIGHNDVRVRGFMGSIGRIELEKAPYYYLCGVDVHFRWDLNLHVAFKECEGASFEIDDRFIKASFINAERIQITKDYIDWSLLHADDKAYNTCRNWWFANYLRSIGVESFGEDKQLSLW